MMALVAWGDRWASGGHPPVHFRHASCGHDTTAAVVCEVCGDPLRAADLRVHEPPRAAAAER